MDEILTRAARWMKAHLPLCLLLLFAFSLLPLLAVGVYDFPAVDDYNYGMQVHGALSGGGFPLCSALGAAVRKTAETYLRWQGTYAAVFLMSLQPAAFSVSAYAAVPFLMLGALIFSTFALLHTIFCRCLSLERKEIVLIGVPVLFLQIQFVPSPVEAFYWYNGAVYYTFFYSLMLLYLRALLRIACGLPHGGRALVSALVLAVLLGGGNYVTALLVSLLGLVFLFFSRAAHRPDTKRLILPEAVLAACFLVSAMAPGNRVRQQRVRASGPVQAVFHAIAQAVADAGHWAAPVLILVFLLLLPVIWRITAKIKFSFRWPGLWILLTFLLFAAQNVPSFYAQSTAGPGRMRDIVYDSFVWLVFLDLAYFAGWARRTFSCLRNRISAFFQRNLAASERGALRTMGACLVCLLLAASVFHGEAPDRFGAAVCARDLARGTAASYHSQQMERQKLLESGGSGDMILPALTAYPRSLFFDDITKDPKDWRNRGMAAYFGKNTITRQ